MVRPRKRAKKKGILILLLIVLLLTNFYMLYMVDKKSTPIAIEISEKYATKEINQKIDKATDTVIKDLNLTCNDFFVNTMNQKEQLNYMSVDTLLINEVCSKISIELSDELTSMQKEKIKLPIGLFAGFNLFADVGPKYSITVIPIGDSVVDYETSFESVGINQVNFHIWLNITTDVSVINPLYSKNIKLTRKLMLVNTVFNGDVPSSYLNMEH